MPTIELFESALRLPPLARTTLAFSLQKRTRSVHEASASNLDDLIASQVNPFVFAIHRAYASHLPLVLSPDDLWLCLAQGFGLHVQLHAETLRDHFVSHAGQLTIEVRRDEFVPGSPLNDWPAVFEEFSEQLAFHLGHVKDLIVADFSTTTAIERNVSQIVLMSAMRPYFKYDFTTICGIPSITLLGTPEDWKAIRRRVEAFGQYGLERWLTPLLPILDQFVAASAGDVDRNFWQSIYKLEGGCGDDHVSGWINTLFPYIKCDSQPFFRDSGKLRENDLAHHWDGGCADKRIGPLNTQYPWGLSRAPFLWNILFTTTPMEFLGGFVGVSQNPETLALRPAIGWAVRRPPFR